MLLGDPGAELVVRSYSIANAPRRDGLITLLVTRVPGGQVSAWCTTCSAPVTRCCCPAPMPRSPPCQENQARCCTSRAGPGWPPVRALAEAALRRRMLAPAALFFSARTERDLIDDMRFRGWQRRHPGFRYLRTLTRADGPPPTGRIPVILGDWLPDLPGWRVYIAGAPGFVTACAADARACGAWPAGAHRGVLRRATAVGSRAVPSAAGACL